MGLFTTADREAINNLFVDLAYKNQDIASVILVGSGSVGFTDKLSDLDFCVVVNKKENIENVMDSVCADIKEHLRILYLSQMPKRGLQVYLIDNYLELDVGYVSIDNVTARRERWKVVFDKVGTVDSDMRKSWERSSKENLGKTHSVDLDKMLEEISIGIWHPLFYAALAIKREQYWRCVGEMEIARNQLIELKGYRYSLETKRYRDVDKFPTHDLTLLQETFALCFSQRDLFNSLNCLVDAIYDELEVYCEKHIIVNRHNVKEYIKSVSN